MTLENGSMAIIMDLLSESMIKDATFGNTIKILDYINFDENSIEPIKELSSSKKLEVLRFRWNKYKSNSNDFEDFLTDALPKFKSLNELDIGMTILIY